MWDFYRVKQSCYLYFCPFNEPFTDPTIDYGLSHGLVKRFFFCKITFYSYIITYTYIYR